MSWIYSSKEVVGKVWRRGFRLKNQHVPTSKEKRNLCIFKELK